MGILIVFGNIDFQVDKDGNPVKAIVNDVDKSIVVSEKRLKFMLTDFLEGLCYIIPQQYKGEIEWK